MTFTAAVALLVGPGEAGQIGPQAHIKVIYSICLISSSFKILLDTYDFLPFSSFLVNLDKISSSISFFFLLATKQSLFSFEFTNRKHLGSPKVSWCRISWLSKTSLKIK